MTKHLKNDLARLEQRLQSLSQKVEFAVKRSIVALRTCNTEVALEVIAGDHEIDEAEVEIEEECLKLLALHQPVANDLRFTAACLKINNDLERIGDLAVNIAERSASLDRVLPFEVPSELEPMSEQTAGMLRMALEAFLKGDVELAMSVRREDNLVDEANRKIIGMMVEHMKTASDQVDDALLILSASKNLERIADHATNIAEDVVYMVEGEIVRHQASPTP